jgi:5-methyltetrahydrofolate corrinoid/iron sulfur protein methyltransferase
MLLIADNIQITNTTIQKAVDEMNPEPIQDMAKKCDDAGAEAIDINSGPLGRGAEQKMSFLVKAVQDVTDLPVFLDTANPKALEAGLNVNKKKAIINGFSLEPEKLASILPLAKQFNVDIIGYLLYPNSHVPPDEQERLTVAVELYSEFLKSGIENDRLIIDPIVVPLTWQNGPQQAMDVISVLNHLPELLGFPVKTIVGLSNLTTGKGPKDKKLLLERTYLSMLAASGLSMVLLNVFHYETVSAAKACKVLTNSHIFTWENIGGRT